MGILGCCTSAGNAQAATATASATASMDYGSTYRRYYENPSSNNEDEHRLRPPDKCDGYPSHFSHRRIPTSCREESFYVPSGTGEEEEEGEGRRRIACTLVYHRRHRGADDTVVPGDDGGGEDEEGEDGGIDPVDSIRGSIDAKLPVIVLCHGAFSWRNQMLLSNLAAALAWGSAVGGPPSAYPDAGGDAVGDGGGGGFHTLRFDFRGNGHSSGRWRYAGYGGEAEDLRSVIKFAVESLGCLKIACVVGHSKGAATALRFAREQEGGGGGERVVSQSPVSSTWRVVSQYRGP